MKVLISAYACEPHKGSEGGIGWNWSRQIAKITETWVITRMNNKEVIDKEVKKNPEFNLHFVYVDLPKWMRFWKRGAKGVHLYYYLWQFAAFMKAKGLAKRINFDIGHHITFVNNWLPSFLAFLSCKFVWGPIGSNQAMPREFLLNFRTYLLQVFRLMIQRAFRWLNPLYYITAYRADKIIIINSRCLKEFPLSRLSSRRFSIVPANAVELFERKRKTSRDKIIKIISVGRLMYIKAFNLAIESFAGLYRSNQNVILQIVGDGIERKNLEKLVARLSVADKVFFTGNLERYRVLQLMRESDVFLFTSFENGGMVILEAMALGLPIVCLDYGGPGEMVTDTCGIKVKAITHGQTVKELTDAILKLANNPELRVKMGKAGRKRVEDEYSWEKKGEMISKIYGQLK